MWNLQSKTKNKTEIGIENKQVVAGAVRGWGTKQVKENKRYKLSAMELISHEDVMNSVGNIVNNTVITLQSDRRFTGLTKACNW